jgi:hypothetical protein
MKIPKQKKRGRKPKYDFTVLKGPNKGIIEGDYGLQSAAYNYAKRNDLDWKFKSTREDGKELVWRIK